MIRQVKPHGRAAGWLPNVLLLTISLALSLAMGEWVARSAGEDMTPPPPLTSYLASPWGSVMARAVAPDTANSHGSFDLERPLSKPVGTLRVAVLGDSFLGLPTLPHEVQAPQSIKRELDRMKGCGDRTCEILNFSVSSAGTVNELLRYRLDARRFAPDLTVVFFTVSNDARNNSVTLQPRMEAAPIPLPGFTLHPDGSLRKSRSLRRPAPTCITRVQLPTF
jgi:hypothetical protein